MPRKKTWKGTVRAFVQAHANYNNGTTQEQEARRLVELGKTFGQELSLYTVRTCLSRDRKAAKKFGQDLRKAANLQKQKRVHSQAQGVTVTASHTISPLHPVETVPKNTAPPQSLETLLATISATLEKVSSEMTEARRLAEIHAQTSAAAYLRQVLDALSY